MKKIYSAIIASPIGKLGLIIHDEKLNKIEFLSDDTKVQLTNDACSKEWVAELKYYFNHPTHCFQLAIQMKGTAFQLRVWRALQRIASGSILTYGELSKKLQTGPRAIGQACRTNPIPIVVPCHRIVAASSLGGYAGNVKGRFRDIKTWLLQHEDVNIKGEIP